MKVEALGHERAADPFTSVDHTLDPFTGTLLGPARIPAAIGTVVFIASGLASEGKVMWSQVAPTSGETMSAAMARTFRLDSPERQLWALPQPYFAHDALCIYRPQEGIQVGVCGADYFCATAPV